MKRKKASSVPLVLASASPRRRRLLRQAGFAFQVKPSRYQEGVPRGNARAFVRRAAAGKAREVASRMRQPAWVLAADTLVVQDRRIFGKPGTQAAAAAMLRRLSGKVHEVVTGVILLHSASGRAISWVEQTKVRMRTIAAAELRRYLATGEWRGKAGAYAIQGRAGVFVTRITGCFFNVVGLPLGSLCARARALGIQP